LPRENIKGPSKNFNLNYEPIPKNRKLLQNVKRFISLLTSILSSVILSLLYFTIVFMPRKGYVEGGGEESPFSPLVSTHRVTGWDEGIINLCNALRF